MSVIGDGNVELYFDFRQIKDSSQNDAAQIRVKTDLTTAPLDTYTVSVGFHRFLIKNILATHLSMLKKCLTMSKIGEIFYSQNLHIHVY